MPITGQEILERRKKKRENNAVVTGEDILNRRKTYQTTDTSSVDQKYIDSFRSDSNTFLTTAEKDYGGVGWANASSSYDSRNSTWQDLSARADAIGAWLYKNRDSLDSEEYKTLSDELYGFRSSGSSIMDTFKSAVDHYSQWETEDEYNKWYEEYQQQQQMASSAEGQQGWEKYLADKEARENSKDEESFWDKIGRYLTEGGGVTDTSLPTGTTTAAINAVRNDTSYQQPQADWTEEQQRIFGYLYQTSPNEAFKYATSTNIQNKKDAEEKALKEIAKSATSNFWAGAGHTLGAIASAPLGLADYLSDLVNQTAGRPITSDGIVSPFEYSQAVTSGISTHLNEMSGTLNENIPVFGGKGLGDLYGLGTSIAQSMTSAYTLGQYGTLISYFGQGAASGVDEAKSRGASDGQALLYGTSLGVFEGLAEMIGVDNLFKLGSTSTVKGFIRNIVKQAGAEGMEEGLTAFLSNIADNVIMGDKSNFSFLVAQYMADGMSEDEAQKKAWLTTTGDLVFDTLAGAVSGGVSGGIHTTANTIASNAYAKKYGQSIIDEGGQERVDALKQLALEMYSGKRGDDAYTGNALAKKVAKKASTKNVGLLANHMESNIASQNQSDIETALVSKGLSKKEAKMVSEYLTSNEEITEEQQRKIEGNERIQSVVDELLADPSFEVGGNWAKYLNAMSISKPKEAPKTTATEQASTATTTSTPTEKETATETSFKVSEDGKARLGDTEISIKEIASIKNGEVMLRLDDGSKDGSTVKASEVSFSSNEEGLLYENVVDMGLNAVTANAFINGYDGNISVEEYVGGFRQAYGYGEVGIPKVEMNGEGFAPRLTASQKDLAYNHGAINAKYKAKKEQEEINARKEKAKAKKESASTPSDAVKKKIAREKESAQELRDLEVVPTIDKMRSELERTGRIVDGKTMHGERFSIRRLSNGKYVATVEGQGSGGYVANDFEQQFDTFEDAYYGAMEFIYNRDPHLYGIETDEPSTAKAEPKTATESVYDGDLSELTDIQRASIEVIRELGLFDGRRLIFFSSYVDKHGNRVYKNAEGEIVPAPNGITNPDGSINIDLNAGEGGEGLIFDAISHELTHLAKMLSPEKFQSYVEFLLENYPTREGITLEQEVQLIRFEYSLKGEELDFEEGVEDFACRASERMLHDIFVNKDTTALEKLGAKDKNLAQKIIDFITNILDKIADKIKSLYAKYEPMTPQAKQISKMGDKAAELRAMWADMVGDALETDRLLSNFDAEPSTDIVPVEERTKYSFRSLAEAAGFEAIENEDGTRSFIRDRKAVSKVTVEDIENSPIGAFINYSLEKKDITEADAKNQKEMFAKICTMACQTNDFSMAMQFVGSAVFTGMKANADKQYGTTYDFPSICTKTQAVIDAMSARMVKLGRGLSTEEITGIYRDVFASGNPVPCPECYVFSRWIGIGGLLDNIKKYQDYYGDMSVDDVRKAYKKMHSQVSAFAEEQKITFGKAKGALTSKLTKEYNKLTEKIEKKENQGEKVDESDRKRLAEIEPMMNTVKAMTWIENVYFADSALTKVNPKFRVPNEVLFDLNKGEAFASVYKAAWAFRTTQGAGYGKAITPYAEARLGEGVLVTNNTTNAIKGKAQGTLKNYFLQQKGQMDAQARKALDNARAKQKNQAFIGGQRFQSTSDARYENASDYLLAALEMQAMHGMVQVYTKVDGAVAAFETWGFSSNQSLMPMGGGLDADGNVQDTSVGGMHPRVATENRNKHEHAGTITIGVNDNHIRALYRLLNRDFIIPYHASGGKADVVAEFRTIQEGMEKRGVMVRSTDYSRTQSDKVLSDEVLAWLGKTEAEIEQIHKVREARIGILTRGKVDMDVVRGNRFLSALYDKLHGGEWDGVKLAKGKVASQIFPNEFWDQSVTYEESGKITRDYLEYCDDLGFLHRFSGLVPSNGMLVSVKGYDENGNRVTLTDLAYQYDENGQKTDVVEDFYWKNITDRRMYGHNGQYLPQKVVTLNDTTKDTVTSFAKNNYGRQYDKELSLKTADKVAKKKYSLRVTDKSTLSFLNEQLKNGEVTEVYRAMAVDEDGNLYPPMAGYVRENGKKVINGQPSVIGEWEQSTESIPWDTVDEEFLIENGFKQYNPTKGYPNGRFERENTIFYRNKDGEWKAKFHLDKDNGETVDAAYAPYIHTSLSVLNDQFTSAYTRDNLVVVRGYVPNSEVNGVDGKRYQAKFADKPVGETTWHSGVVAAQMPETRIVILSRYFMPIEIVEDSVVAQKTKEMMKGKDIEIPYNVITPSQRRAMEAIGIRIGEARGLKDPPKKNKVKYSHRILMGSLFSGGGTLEAGLAYQMLDKEFGVEYDGRIASVYADNHGDHIQVGKVEDFDISKYDDIFYLHASPVCHNFSKAKHGAKELQMDLDSAKATAKHLETAMPQVFTVENAPGYRKSQSLKIITDKLTELGYKWDVDVYNSADYGSATSRNRVILRAVKEGELPEKPSKQERTNSWDKVTRDLWDTLPKSYLRPSFISAIENTPSLPILDANGKVNVNKPLLILTTTSGHTVTYCWEGEICPTLTTKCGEAKLVMPDGNIYAVTPEFMGRIQGLPDDYKYPKAKTRAFTIIGNGIPTQLTKAVVGGVLDSAYEQTHDGKALYSLRTTESVSNRSLLANALESVAQNDIERNKLKEYKGKISLIESEQTRLAELRSKIKELSFAKGERDTEALKKLQFEANQTANRINTYDRQLLNLESTKALKGVLEREKQMAYKRAEQRGREALKVQREKDRERNAKTQRELLERYQESRQRGIEGRKKTEMRYKIKKVVNELNEYLKNTKDKHVPIQLQKPVADALSAVNMDTVGAEQRIAKKREEMRVAAAKGNIEKVEQLAKEIENIQEMGGNLEAKLSRLKTVYDSISNSTDPLIANSHDAVISNTIAKVIEVVGDTPLRDMSLGKLEAVYDMYKMVLATIRKANKAFKAAKGEEISTIANGVIAELAEKKRKSPYTSTAGKVVSAFDWNNLKPVYAFERIGSANLSKVFNSVLDAEGVWATDMEEAKAFRTAQQEKYNFKSWDFDEKHGFTSTSGEKFELNLGEIMSLYAWAKDGDAKTHLFGDGFQFDPHKEVVKKIKGVVKVTYNFEDATSYKLSQEILDEITAKMTQEQRDFADAMQDYLSNTMGEKGNEVSLELYEIKLFKNKVYFPLKVSHEFLAVAKEQAEGKVRVKNKGFTNERKKNAKNTVILSSFMDVWKNHVQEMSMYHAFTLPLEDFRRVIGYSAPSVSEGTSAVSVREKLINAHGKASAQYIDQLFDDINGGAKGDPRETLAKSFVSRFKKTSVVASLSVTAQQPTAIVRAMAIVNPKYFVGKKVNKGKIKEKWETMKKYAPVCIIKEMGGFDTSTGYGAVEWLGGEKTFMDKVDDVLGWAPEFADKVTWIAIWNAVERETVHKNKNLAPNSEEFLKAVGERFTEVIRKTQVYDSTLARSANMRSKGLFMTILTSFMAEPTTSINMLADAFRKIKSNPKYFAKTLGAVYGSVILNAAIVSLIYAMRDDDEDETFAEKYASRVVTEIVDGINPLTYIPGVKDVWSIAQGFDVERADMTLVTNVFDSLQQVIRVTGKDTSDMDEDELSEHYKSVAEAWMSVGDSISSIFGLPVKNIRRDVKGVFNLFETLGRDQETTAGSLADKIGDDLKDSVPVWGWLPKESKGDKFYDAIVDGDKDYAERMKEYAEMEHFFTALREEGPIMAQAVKEVIISAKVDEGKTIEEAEESFVNGVKSSVKNHYEKGDLSYNEAMDMLTDFCGLSKDEAEIKIQYWDYKQDNPDADVVESWFEKYNEEVSSSGISIDMYIDYRTKIKGIEGDKDNNGNTISGSKKAKIMAVINSLPISNAQKDALYFAEGWTASKLWEAPWH